MNTTNVACRALAIFTLFASACQPEVPLEVDAETPRVPAPAGSLSHWTFIYVASLDNDLDAFSAHLQDQLTTGVCQSGVSVSVLLDDHRPDGLRRLALTSRAIEETVLPTDDSTDVRTLEEFLHWTSENMPAEGYVLTFIDHGGRLDEMGRDDHRRRGEPSTTSWMPAADAADVVRQWRGSLGQGRLELLFFEQCGRASIENLYSFAGSAEYVLASEVAIHCPGTYYPRVLECAGEGFCTDGMSVAESILEGQSESATFVLVEGDALWELPEQVDAVIDAYQAVGIHSMRSTPMLRPCYCHEDECHVDLLGCLRALFESDDRVPPPAVSELASWLREELVVLHQRSSDETFEQRSCGLSVCLPAPAARSALYADLPFYHDGRWGEFVKP